MRYARWPVLGLPGCQLLLTRRDGEWVVAIEDAGGDWSQWCEKLPDEPVLPAAGSLQLDAYRQFALRERARRSFER